MANAMHRFHLVESEAEPDWNEDLDQEEGPVLDAEQVEWLLLGAPLRTQRHRDREPAVASGVAAESHDLAAMRGVMVGLALTIPVWALIGAILALG